MKLSDVLIEVLFWRKCAREKEKVIRWESEIIFEIYTQNIEENWENSCNWKGVFDGSLKLNVAREKRKLWLILTGKALWAAKIVFCPSENFLSRKLFELQHWQKMNNFPDIYFCYWTNRGLTFLSITHFSLCLINLVNIPCLSLSFCLVFWEKKTWLDKCVVSRKLKYLKMKKNLWFLTLPKPPHTLNHFVISISFMICKNEKQNFLWLAC